MKDVQNRINELIQENQDFAIFSHMRPDGDSIGSSIALDLLLKKLGKNSKVFFRDEVPEVYSFLPETKNIYDLDDFEARDFDVLFVLDISEISRIGLEESDLRGKKIVCIDHHHTNSGFARHNLIDSEKAATALILCEFFREHYLEHIDINIALCLLTGIITDTGAFRYQNTKSDVFDAVSHLIATGVNYPQLMEKLYGSFPARKFELIKKAFSRSQKVDNAMYSYITIEDFEETNCFQEDTDGIVNQFTIYKEIDIAFVLMEISKEQQKVSIRSKKTDISEVAVRFGGGGHKNAAGFNVKGNTLDNIKKILNVIKEINLNGR
ncbi:MAG: bifunctional oligoribonuclease/PAP phosphatase NrnA [Candidatus Muirbacterium halophilum]|nr:bifunctional oligoribonuclease/PAP phosphatase NrnA [Candidatus Muirbacterium halophilum]MCK9475678.1 bifunctional oligoribonuclease/PAP phosphatase NrnA [Candidatus Muirbacterium halophilum]